MSNEFINEVNQEIKDEKLISVWNRFKYVIIGGCIAIIAGTGIYTWYTSSIIKTMETQNMTLDKAMGDMTALNAIIGDSADGVQFVAVLNKAKLLADDKKYTEAVSALESYASQTDTLVHREYATLSAIWLQMQSGAISTVPSTLDTLTQSAVFGDLAKLTKVEIILKSGDTKQATDILQSIIDSNTSAQEYKSLATKILRGL